MQIAVLGMHRSGTSAIARLLNLAGCGFGPSSSAMAAHADNPLGFWERQDVCDLHEWVLAEGGAAWDRPLAFEADGLSPAVHDEFVARAEAIIDSFPTGRPWFVKDPRLCVLLPLWRPLLREPVCVHIIRHPLEVAASLAVRNGIPIGVGLALWELHVVRARRAAFDLNWVGVRHRDLLVDPVTTLADTVTALRSFGVSGLHMPSEREITDFITSDLHHHHWDRPDLADWTDCPQVRLFEAIDADFPDADAIPDVMSLDSVATLARIETIARSGCGVAESPWFAPA